MIQKSTIQLLRFHFSFFLLPVYLFAISQVPDLNRGKAVLIFLILHLLVYPSSNGYNSYMDRDESPIGGLENPLQPTKQLLITTVVMDLVAVLLSLIISPVFSLGILLYILASRSYSYRKIRLKQFAIPAFLVVFVFQGAFIFSLVWYGANEHAGPVPLLPCFVSSLLIGALYPLTQIYQHEADKRDGVTSLSYLLGKKGTFIFSMLLFLTATALMYFFFNQQQQLQAFFRYLIIMLPVVLFFLYWMVKVWRNDRAANFKNSLLMNVVATACTSIFFLTLIVMNH